MADKLVFTPIASIPSIVASVKKNFETNKTKSYDYRIGQLKALRNMMVKEEKRWMEAMDKDLRQNQFLKLIELKYCISDIDDAIANLYDWMQPEARSNNQLANLPGSAYLYKEPFGTVLIIAPWNYPIQLCVRPLVGAIAAGNAAIIKPSEVSEATAKVFSDLVPQYLDTSCYSVVQGGVAETKELLKIRFDYIFYTGNPMVGKEIMKAAAEYLTPVTLELGGKSPVIIDKNVDIDAAVRRVFWGKCLNIGQSCIAPDYILVHRERMNEFIEKGAKQLKEWYSNGEFEKDPSLSRIINERHTERLKRLLESAKSKQVIGGKIYEKEKFIEPTILVEPALDAPVMQEEIFGPLLPVLPVDSIEEAINFVNKREKPLALYIFSRDRAVQEKILNETSSGSVCINETMLQFCVPDLPFGGVGTAGFGAYNGKTSFDTFTHNKSVLDRPTWLELSVRFPPYTSGKVSMLNLVLGKSLPSIKSIAKWTLPVVIPVVSAAAYYYSKL